jgi:hypothetical protein
MDIATSPLSTRQVRLYTIPPKDDDGPPPPVESSQACASTTPNARACQLHTNRCSVGSDLSQVSAHGRRLDSGRQCRRMEVKNSFADSSITLAIFVGRKIGAAPACVNGSTCSNPELRWNVREFPPCKGARGRAQPSNLVAHRILLHHCAHLNDDIFVESPTVVALTRITPVDRAPALGRRVTCDVCSGVVRSGHRRATRACRCSTSLTNV